MKGKGLVRLHLQQQSYKNIKSSMLVSTSIALHWRGGSKRQKRTKNSNCSKLQTIFFFVVLQDSSLSTHLENI